MGCGASSGGGSSLSRDPEDYHLDHLHFDKMKIPEFDEYLCDGIAPPVNTLVDIINDINGCIDEVKDAAAIILGAFKVDITLEESKETDKVILSLQKVDGTPLTEPEVKKLFEDAKVQKADADLAKARKALHAAMEKSYVKLLMGEDGEIKAESAHDELDAFKKALGELKAAVGSTYKVTLVHKSAGSGGAACVRAHLVKPVFPSKDKLSDSFTWEPVTLFDTLLSKQHKNIFAAEQSVADGLAGLTKQVKNAEEAGLSVSFTIVKSKLKLEIAGEEPEDGEAKAKYIKARGLLRKATLTANMQLFKLQKAARNANGDVNIAKALIATIKAFKTSAMAIIKEAGKEVTDIIKLDPKIKFSMDDGVDFDLGLKINVPGVENLDPMAALEKLLPGPAKLVLKAILAIKDKIVEMIPKFGELKDQIMTLVDKSGEVFEDVTGKITSALGDNMSAMALMSMAKAIMMNAKEVAIEPARVIKTMVGTVGRLSDEFAAAVEEIKKEFP